MGIVRCGGLTVATPRWKIPPPVTVQVAQFYLSEPVTLIPVSLMLSIVVEFPVKSYLLCVFVETSEGYIGVLL